MLQVMEPVTAVSVYIVTTFNIITNWRITIMMMKVLKMLEMMNLKTAHL